MSGKEITLTPIALASNAVVTIEIESVCRINWLKGEGVLSFVENLVGRLENTPLSAKKPLAPLFECIDNSIDAIEEAANGSGNIVVSVMRDDSQARVDDQLPPISGFRVDDDGVGFTDENMLSFTEADSRHKRSLGGKGVGRFLWLKAFDSADIESRFKQDGQWYERQFEFNRKAISLPDGKTPLLLEGPNARGSTSVVLSGFVDAYRKYCPDDLEEIGARIVDHFMLRFALGANFTLKLVDDLASISIDLSEMYRKRVTQMAKISFVASGEPFELSIFKMQDGGREPHRVHYCARKRSVKSEKLEKLIPDMASRFVDETTEDSFTVSCCITGETLEQEVNQERTDFGFRNGDTRSLFTKTTWDELTSEAVEKIQASLEPYLTEIRERKALQLREYIDNAPEYRPLLSGRYDDLLVSIPPNLSPDRMDDELHRTLREAERRHRRKAKDILADGDLDEDAEALRTKFERFCEEENELGKAALAKYIIHRKVVLDVFERALQLQESGRYALEEAIHKLIFPLRATSDDVFQSQQNLWIIDEKLSYHRYLASDKPISSFPEVGSTSAKEPDLAVFKVGPSALVDSEIPFSAAVIIEFKRPARENYTDNDNPVQQVMNYIEQIRDNKARDRVGRIVPVTSNTPFYAYIICDITDKIRRFANLSSLHPSPDGMGFFGHLPAYNCVIEVISYDKLLSDAKRRNRVLFDRLHLPTS